MTWKDLLQAEVDDTYRRTLGLLELVDDGALDWKPATGENWMSTGQLLHHLTNACGFCFKGFVTGDWGMPADFDPSTASHEDMLPPAERLPAVASVAEARRLVEEDQALALATLAGVSEEELETRPAPAPWDPSQVLLGHRLLQMVEHLKQHKGQLFYYLKLQGQPVNTMHLWA
ncbi:MAG: DinB family protein [Candidatus Delongbacteria bacterium]